MRKFVNRALAALMIVFMMTVLVMTIVKYSRNYAYGLLISYRNELGEFPTAYERIRARIAKFEYNTNNRLFTRQTLRELNVDMQKALNKSVMDLGSARMVWLKCGACYDLFTGPYSHDKIDELTAFARALLVDKGVPTMFIYCHAGLYEPGQLPEAGLYTIDNNEQFADELVSAFRAASVPVTDSRDVYDERGLTMDQAILKSDIHWAHRMALETADAAVTNINRACGTAFDEDALNYDRFVDEVYPELLLGEFGQRIGRSRVIMDDIHLLYPAYDTSISYEAENNGHVSRRGTFYEALIEPKKLEPDEGKDVNTAAYYVYGEYLAQTHTVNENAPEGRVLVFKDSYGTPITAFLSLACREVYAVDLRNTFLSMEEWVEKVKPDVVLFAYSQQMMRDFDYVIAN